MEYLQTTTADTSVEQKLQNSGEMMIQQARSLTIHSNEDYEAAGKILVEIKNRVKQVKDYWKKPKADAASAHKTICKRESEMLKPLTEAEGIIKKTMVVYQEAVEKARADAEEAARKRLQEETDRLLEQAIKATEDGNESDAAVNVAMAQMVEDMKPSVGIARPTSAGTSIRKTWKARIVDANAVPAYINGVEIREIKMSTLNDLAKMTNGAIVIPGVEFFQDSTISVRSDRVLH